MGRVLCHASQTWMLFPLRWRPLTAATFFLSNDGNINRYDLQPLRIKTSSSGQVVQRRNPTSCVSDYAIANPTYTV